jgi:7-cyano-7-deazaguanine synthase
MRNAILLSGGIDSIALTFWKRPQVALTIDYGQKPAMAEIRASQAVCSALNITHHVIKVDCSSLGSGDLLRSAPLSMAPASEWWPYRNQLLVTLAVMKAISLGIDELCTASVASDGFHRDGTPRFYQLLHELVNYQEGGLKISAPAIGMSAVELVKISRVLPELLHYAHSCHTGNIPCGHCRGCYKYMHVINALNNDKSQ